MSPRRRVLVIGGGSIGERHVRCFLQTGRADVALCEPKAQVRETVGVRYGLNEAFADFAAALASAPEVAVVCTPAHLHVAMAAELLEAGAAVLIEKPLGTTLEGTQRLLDIARERDTTAGVAYVYRAHPALASLRAALGSGRFGRPVQLTMVSGQHFPFYRPAYRETYYRDRATGGGAIQDALTHMLNAAEWLVGPITELTADAAHLVLEGVDVEDTVHLLARHGALRACYSLNQHQAPNEGTLTIVCERGTLRFEMHRHRWLWCSEPGGDWHEGLAVALERDELFVAQADAFLDAVEGAAPPLCTLAEGLQTLRVNLAALAAADDRRWHSLEPK